MKLIVDGIIFENNPHGGIARIFKNILPIICDMDPELKITLFLRNDRYYNLPEHNQISTIFLSDVYKLRPWRLWKPYFKTIQNLLLRIQIGNTKNKVWLSTYFTRPPFNWQGKEVVWVFDMIYELFPEVMPNSTPTIIMKEKAINNADEIFCISESTAVDLYQLYEKSKGKTNVLHLSHDDIFTVRSKNEIDHHIPYPFILYVGRRTHYKYFDILLNAYSQWNRKGKIKLVAVGPSWSADEEKTIDNLGLSNNIILFEKISDDVLCDLYNQAKAFIYPSRYEGFGIPLLEAMACGCPVVASRIPSTTEVAGNIPIYFEPSDSESLLDALNFLFSHNNLQERIDLGIEKAAEFTWEKTAKMFYSNLKTINAN